MVRRTTAFLATGAAAGILLGAGAEESSGAATGQRAALRGSGVHRPRGNSNVAAFFDHEQQQQERDLEGAVPVSFPLGFDDLGGTGGLDESDYYSHAADHFYDGNMDASPDYASLPIVPLSPLDDDDSGADATNEIGGGAQTRIVGGTASTAKPWFACTLDFQSSGTYLGGCGGTIIGKRHFLTAAHCISSKEEGDMKHRMDAMYVNCFAPLESGPTGKPNNDLPMMVANVVEWNTHPLHNPAAASTHDLAVVKVNRDLWGNGEMTPPASPLPVCSENFVDYTYSLPASQRYGTALGFGYTSYNGKMSSRLREVDVPLVEQSVCKDKMKGIANVDESMICAGGIKGKDACAGDSGGPLTLSNPVSGEECLGGVVSWGYRCAEEGYPGVYARPHVPEAMEWLQSVVGDMIVMDAPGNDVGVGYAAPQTTTTTTTTTSTTTTTTTKTTTAKAPEAAARDCSQDNSAKFNYVKNGKAKSNKKCSKIKEKDCPYPLLSGGGGGGKNGKNAGGATNTGDGRTVANVCPRVCNPRCAK
mmetsp:Transcript_3769/g.10129  ORF Transcript_3769/g.10129 Transcript_3769/m.10129 type:complete len:532 (-) Transcript_3769:305-1900(-)